MKRFWKREMASSEHGVFSPVPGEIAYLMLSRASEPLRAKIRNRLTPSFDPDHFAQPAGYAPHLVA